MRLALTNLGAADRRPRWGSARLLAVLLDLDGTLLDSVEDIASALNRALADMRLGAIATAEVRNMIGRGVPTLIARAVARLGAPVSAPDEARLLEQFNHHYGRLHLLKECRSRVYPGVIEGLSQLHGLGLRLAVVTNKPKHFAVALLAELELSPWIDVVVGGDCCDQRKPSPQPLLFACDALQVEPRQALMVGDSATDVLAARAAGIPVVCVPYGYNEGDDPRRLPCDAFIDTLADLPGLLLN